MIDNSLLSTDLKNNQAVKSADIANGQLKDEDIAEAAFVNFSASIGNVPAEACLERRVTGVNATRDHLLLTPNYDTQAVDLAYSAEFDESDEGIIIQACNLTDSVISQRTAKFSLLVIAGNRSSAR